MDRNASGDDSDIDWDSEDEREIQNYPSSSWSSVPNNGGGELANFAEASTSRSASTPRSPSFPDFVGMGFSEELVAKAIKDNGDGTPESILETLLTYRAIENSSDHEADVEQQQHNQATLNSDNSSSDYNENFLCDLSDSDGWLEEEETTKSSSVKAPSLEDMGYTMEEISIAVERCGPHASVDELADFMCAAQMARAEDIHFDRLSEQKPSLKKRLFEREMLKRKKPRMLGADDGEMIRLPNPMSGFGVPSEPSIRCRPFPLPEAAIGLPYFYYENVALAPKGVWDTIKRFLYGVEPEFVDSKYFCAAARKRGYIHNLPIENRFPLLPLPPRTIHEAFPLTKRWWPTWDKRTKLNCLQTCYGSAKLTERIRKALEGWGDGEPPERVQKYVLDECRKWNLVWVGQNKVAPLECDEVEMLLGFPKNHTRGISRTDRYRSLGNSFQVDTVAYHLSVLKDMFPKGINMLSLFSGIGGAEVALHRLGIPLKLVVSVEKSEVNRNVVQSWWEQTNQKGKLIHFPDVQQVDGDRLQQIIFEYGGFDLVVGGSPCNNLAGSNRHHRDGLEGKESSLFYDYFRILDLVKCIMGNQI